MAVSTAEWSESRVGRIVSAGVLYLCGCSQAAGAVCRESPRLGTGLLVGQSTLRGKVGLGTALERGCGTISTTCAPAATDTHFLHNICLASSLDT